MSDWTYHASNFRVTTKTTSGNQQNLSYGYDANGNVLSIGDSLFTAGRSFTYDNLNRMITATGPFGPNQSQQNCNGANGFVYNAIGNLTSKCGATLSYSDTIYHPSAVTHHAGLNKSYTYDANGNMLTRGNQTLSWTIDNRVERVAIGSVGTNMEYDYSGMRMKKDGPNGITLYPFAGYEIDPTGVVTKFIRAGGETIASKRGTSKRFYHNDHLGGVNVITDEGGNRCQLIEYDPWGAVSRSEGTCDPDMRFTGQKLDPETGLYYYGGRYYDAEIGRFVSADPFVQAPFDPQNLNRYSYVVNNPQTLVDPTGYFHKIKKPSFWQRFGGTIIGSLVGSIVSYWSPELGAVVGALVKAAIDSSQGGNFLRSFASAINSTQYYNTGIWSWEGALCFVECDFTGARFASKASNYLENEAPVQLACVACKLGDLWTKWGPAIQRQGQRVIDLVRGWWGKTDGLKDLPFKSGEMITRSYETKEGIVEFVADAIVSGKTLHLKDIAVYPRGPSHLAAGLAEIVRIKDILMTEARGLGFEQLRITGERLSGRNPGRLVDVTIDLVK